MSRAFQLLFEIENPHFNLYEKIEVRKVYKETDHGDKGWIERHERWELNPDGADGVDMQSAYSPDGKYIGDTKTAKRLNKAGITSFYPANKDGNVCSVGFNPEEQKWSGWSHRGFASFGIGSKVKKGDCAYTPRKGEWTAKTMDDARQMAIDYANGVS